MKRLLTIIAASAMLLLVVVASVEHPRQPNILFILTDQHRQDGVGAYGMPGIQTPHLDKLAGDGIRFDRAYVAQPVCSPNRASILTGLYPHSHGVVENNVPLPPQALTMSEMLGLLGYDCGYFGKWHLDRRNAQGFTTFPGYPRDGRGSNHYFPGKDNERRYAVDVITDDAIAFIKENRDTPFYAFLAYYPPHPPYSVPKKYEEMYRDLFPKDRRRRIYYGMCTKVDQQVGRLLATLDELGVAENTLVVFTSEHGHLFDHRWNDHSKRLCYDTASRIPLLMRMPGVIPKNRSTTEMISSVDLVPTIMSLLGQKPPAGLGGQDLSGMARNTATRGRDAVFIENTPYPYQPDKGLERCVRDRRWKLILSTVRAPELYDMTHDPDELNNRWEAMKDSAEVGELEDRLKSWASRTGDKLAGQLLEKWHSRSSAGSY